jgi:hypothetical protein
MHPSEPPTTASPTTPDPNSTASHSGRLAEIKAQWKAKKEGSASPWEEVARLQREANNPLHNKHAKLPPLPQQHGSLWTCPRTGLVVPKTPLENLLWRNQLREAAEMDESLQDQLYTACQESCLFWINAFAMTYRQKMTGADGRERPVHGDDCHVPFITWLCQDAAVEDILLSISDGRDLAIRKSRDMGASWLCSTVFHWYWQFQPNKSFKEVSRKEDLVDKRGDMDSLFEKHRYLLRWQPDWLRPKAVRDNYMLLENRENGSVIRGESTNAHVGQGGRNTAILLDEFGRVDNGDEILLSTADTTSCRIVNSTPSGPGTSFHRIIREKRFHIVELPWWTHPEKGVGAKPIATPNGDIRWSNAWYEDQCTRRAKKDIAQNLDMDFGQAGDMFFDGKAVQRHKDNCATAPLVRVDLGWKTDYSIEDKAEIISHRRWQKLTAMMGESKGDWRIWVPLVDGRPPQNYTYVFGIDTSLGSGSSNSVATVIAVEINQVVGKLWSAFMSPEEFAEHVAMGGVWFGGKQGSAFLCWENNGPGGVLGRQLVRKLDYPRFYRQKLDDKVTIHKTPKWGWNSNKGRKMALLHFYREAVEHTRLVNPCAESLDEAMDYIIGPNGTPIPGKIREETAGGQELHGDHVIADALAWMAAEDRRKDAQRDTPGKAPGGSFADRRAKFKRSRQRDNAWSA